MRLCHVLCRLFLCRSVLLLPVLLLPTSVADEEGLLAALVVPDLRSFAPEELLLSPLKGIKEKKLMSQLSKYPSVPS